MMTCGFPYGWGNSYEIPYAIYFTLLYCHSRRPINQLCLVTIAVSHLPVLPASTLRQENSPYIISHAALKHLHWRLASIVLPVADLKYSPRPCPSYVRKLVSFRYTQMCSYIHWGSCMTHDDWVSLFASLLSVCLQQSSCQPAPNYLNLIDLLNSHLLLTGPLFLPSWRIMYCRSGF